MSSQNPGMTGRTGTNKPEDRAQQAMNQAKDQAQRTLEQAKQRTEPAREQAQQTAQDVMQTAQERAQSAISQQKERASHSLDTVAHALHTTGEELRGEDQQMIAQYADKAAEQIERFSEMLSTKDVNEMVGDLKRFAREKPEIFLGGAFALGLMLSRFMKSSRESMEHERGYQPEQGSMYYREGQAYSYGYGAGTQGSTATPGTQGYTGTPGRTGYMGTTSGSTSTTGTTPGYGESSTGYTGEEERHETSTASGITKETDSTKSQENKPDEKKNP